MNGPHDDLPPASGTLVIGVGNDYRSDDAAGLGVARRLRKLAPDRFTIVEHSGEGTALVESFGQADEVIVVDAVSSGAPPGSIHRCNAIDETMPREFSRHSSHVVGVAEAIELARVLKRLPRELVIYGIEGKSFQMGTGLCPEVARAVEKVASMIVERKNG